MFLHSPDILWHCDIVPLCHCDIVTFTWDAGFPFPHFSHVHVSSLGEDGSMQPLVVRMVVLVMILFGRFGLKVLGLSNHLQEGAGQRRALPRLPRSRGSSHRTHLRGKAISFCWRRLASKGSPWHMPSKSWKLIPDQDVVTLFMSVAKIYQAIYRKVSETVLD